MQHAKALGFAEVAHFNRALEGLNWEAGSTCIMASLRLQDGGHLQEVKAAAAFPFDPGALEMALGRARAAGVQHTKLKAYEELQARGTAVLKVLEVTSEDASLADVAKALADAEALGMQGSDGEGDSAVASSVQAIRLLAASATAAAEASDLPALTSALRGWRLPQRSAQIRSEMAPAHRSGARADVARSADGSFDGKRPELTGALVVRSTCSQGHALGPEIRAWCSGGMCDMCGLSVRKGDDILECTSCQPTWWCCRVCTRAAWHCWRVCAGQDVALREGPSLDGAILAKMLPGDMCLQVGEEHIVDALPHVRGIVLMPVEVLEGPGKGSRGWATRTAEAIGGPSYFESMEVSDTARNKADGLGSFDSGYDARSRHFARWAQAVQEVLEKEHLRAQLQAEVDEAEDHFAARRWAELQDAKRSLDGRGVRVEDEVSSRWQEALAGHNTAVMRSLANASTVFKGCLTRSRLQGALDAPSISLSELEAAAADAEARHVGEHLVERAREDAAQARRSLSNLDDAVKRKRVDTAEVLLWQLENGRVTAVEEAAAHAQPLLRLVDDLKTALPSRDMEALEAASAGWGEDNSEEKHEAFERLSSPTRWLRAGRMLDRTNRLEVEARMLDQQIDGVGDRSQPRKILVDRLGPLLFTLRRLMSMGWSMPNAVKARLIHVLPTPSSGSLVEADSAKADTRFAAALLRAMETRVNASVVMLLDQSGSVGDTVFAEQLKPAAVQIARIIHNATAGNTSWGAVAYGPVQLIGGYETLIPGKNFDGFIAAIDAHRFGRGSTPTADAFRKALDLLGGDDAKQDGVPRIVFNFTDGAPGHGIRGGGFNDLTKGATLALKSLEAHGVVVISVGIGPGIHEEKLRLFSSPGLVFMVSDFSELRCYIDRSFSAAERWMAEVVSLTDREILDRIESFR